MTMTTELVELADRLEAFTRVSESGRSDDGIEGAIIPGKDCYDFDDDMMAAATAIRALASRAGGHPDTVRMDWLADMDNAIGNVQLPAVCVMNNLHDMRAAIDEAMRLDPEIAAVIAAAPEPVAVRPD